MAMNASSNSPPRFSESERFDGTNWIVFKSNILILTDIRGATGYLNGSVPQPTATLPPQTTEGGSPTTPNTAVGNNDDLGDSVSAILSREPSSWTSATPTLDEWTARNAYVKGLILFNVVNPIGLGVKLDGTAAEAWESLVSQYDVHNEIALVHAQRELRELVFKDGDDFDAHLATLRIKWNHANATGANITDQDFRIILLSSLPRSWDPIVATLYDVKTSSGVISRLQMHWARVKTEAKSSTHSSSAFQATTRTNAHGRQSQPRQRPVCTNANCGRRGHLIQDCYWEGGGKEGQFPPGFGQRRNIPQQPSNNTVIAASATTTPTQTNTATPAQRIYALSAITHFGQLDITPTLRKDTIVREYDEEVMAIEEDDEVFLISKEGLVEAYPEGAWDMESSDEGECGDAKEDDDGNAKEDDKEGEHKDNEIRTYITAASRDMLPGGVDPETDYTYVDSGATDHCFRDRTDFLDYVRVDDMVGHSATEEGRFLIFGKGTVRKSFEHDGRTTTVLFQNALHTPDLAANLISVSRLDAAGFDSHFGKGRVTFLDDDFPILTGFLDRGMYKLNTVPTDVNDIKAMTSIAKKTDEATWHRRLAHVSTRTIRRMLSKGLVDGLEILARKCEEGRCEDCILGKQTARPYDDEVTPESEPLERLHIDLWGRARVRSLGGAYYMMVIVDGGTSRLSPYFLADKSANTTLRVFREYVEEAERQTGRKVKRVRVDMGREWLNDEWDAYLKEKGIILECGAAYAHGSNGVAERAIRTIIEGVRTVLVDSGAPHFLWAEAAATVAYVRNLTPSARHPDTIPEEAFTQKRQNISHLRPFGCVAYAHIPSEIDHSKLSPRSSKYNLIGYYGRDAYKLYDPTSRAIVKARNVVFEEGRGHRTLSTTIPDLLDDVLDTGVTTSTSNGPIRPTPPIAPRPQPLSTPSPFFTPPTSPPSPPHPGSTSTDDLPSVVVDDVAQPTPLPVPPRRSSRLANRVMMVEVEDEDAPHIGVKKDEDKPGSDTWVPRNYREAMLRPDLWVPAMETEMEVMEEKEVFEVVDTPEDATILGTMWVYANKYDGAGFIIRRKARLVVRGENQVKGVDYEESYASVIRLESFRMLLAIAAEIDAKVWQIDFVSAFLNADNPNRTFVRPPHGFGGPPGTVWRARKSVYGTMPAGHDWQEELDRSRAGLGYYKSLADPCVHSRVSGDDYSITGTYTDDVLGLSSTDEEAKRAKGELEDCYELKDVGDVGMVLGISVERDDEDRSITIHQQVYIQKTLERFGMQDCRTKSTPLPAGTTYSTDDAPQDDNDRHFMEDKPFRQLLGCLMWIAGGTRPDIAFAVNAMSRFQQNPGPAHWRGLQHILAYLKGTLSHQLTYRHGHGLKPIGFVDADFGGDVDTRRSTAGYVFFMAGAPVSWSSRRQPTVALSTTEAEYMGMTKAAQQSLWMHSFLSEVGLTQEFPALLYGDNNPAIALCQNEKGHSRAKHIDIRYHYIRELVKSKKLEITYVQTDKNIADIFTKALPRIIHSRLTSQLLKVVGTRGSVDAENAPDDL
jgi:Reverse transcriptase (RNA-dependent DNA polymerase)/gag-polypeptide of LTR copia-type/GAG-pre-integrase domain